MTDRRTIPEVTVRSRPDGIVELAPRVSPLPPDERRIVIFSVLLVVTAFFVSGAIPAAVVVLVALFALVGDIVLAAKAAILALARPLAVIEDAPRRFAQHR